MIIKEIYKTLNNGSVLYKTYSDTNHLIKNVITEKCYSEAIDCFDDIVYEEAQEYVKLDGPDTYEEILDFYKQFDVVSKKVNTLLFDKSNALSIKRLYPQWQSFIGKIVDQGFYFLYDDSLWKTVQTHTVLEQYPPSLQTTSLYERVVIDHEGTIDDPVPYTPPMEIFEGKYYIQNNKLYKCTRNSEISISHNLVDLIGLYVEEV